MTYKVAIKRKALKQLATIDKPARRRIEAAVDNLANDPLPPGHSVVKSMTGYYRIRVGDYRVIYTVDDEVSIVEVERIGHRRDVYDSL